MVAFNLEEIEDDFIWPIIVKLLKLPVPNRIDAIATLFDASKVLEEVPYKTERWASYAASLRVISRCWMPEICDYEAADQVKAIAVIKDLLTQDRENYGYVTSVRENVARFFLPYTKENQAQVQVDEIREMLEQKVSLRPGKHGKVDIGPKL